MKLNILPYLVAGACIAQLVLANPLNLIVITPQLQKEHRPCHAAKLGDSFRKWLGIPRPMVPVMPAKTFSPAGLGAVEVLPAKTFNFGNPAAAPSRVHIGVGNVLPGEHHEQRKHFRHAKHAKPAREFWVRVHRSLMALGPWEGRAVAFVLGCGIGVLLRMAFVLLILSYRMVRGSGERANGSAPPGYEECASGEEEQVCVDVVKVDEKA